MPNGESRNFIRFLRSIAVFRGKFRKWPSKIRLDDSFIREIQEVMDKTDYDILQEKIKIIPDSSNPWDGIYAPEDDEGNKLDLMNVKQNEDDEFISKEVVLNWIGIKFPDYGPQG